MNKLQSKIILDYGKLLKIIFEKKEKGETIVLTNGTFDILHVGHIRNLIHAKSIGNVLIVAVNSDESVKAYKNPLLPINSIDERLEVLAAIECIDYLTSFHEKTADNLILKIKPDFYAKGTDYTAGTVPEKNSVKLCGGKIVIVGDPKNHSSREIIRKMHLISKI